MADGINRFSIRVHYKGELTELPNKKYGGDRVKNYHYCNHDRWSICTLDRVAENLGYSKFSVIYHYLILGKNIEDWLVYVLYEDIAQDLIRYRMKCGLVDVYFVHLKTYSVSGYEVGPCKAKERANPNENQQGGEVCEESFDVEEIMLTNIPVTQFENEGEEDNRGKGELGANKHTGGGTLGEENLKFAKGIR